MILWRTVALKHFSYSLCVELYQIGVDGRVHLWESCNTQTHTLACRAVVPGELRGGRVRSPDCGRDMGGSTGLGCIKMKGSSTETSLKTDAGSG